MLDLEDFNLEDRQGVLEQLVNKGQAFTPASVESAVYVKAERQEVATVDVDVDVPVVTIKDERRADVALDEGDDDGEEGYLVLSSGKRKRGLSEWSADVDTIGLEVGLAIARTTTAMAVRRAPAASSPLVTKSEDTQLPSPASKKPSRIVMLKVRVPPEEFLTGSTAAPTKPGSCPASHSVGTRRLRRRRFAHPLPQLRFPVQSPPYIGSSDQSIPTTSQPTSSEHPSQILVPTNSPPPSCPCRGRNRNCHAYTGTPSVIAKGLAQSTSTPSCSPTYELPHRRVRGDDRARTPLARDAVLSKNRDGAVRARSERCSEDRGVAGETKRKAWRVGKAGGDVAASSRSTIR